MKSKNPSVVATCSAQPVRTTESLNSSGLHFFIEVLEAPFTGVGAQGTM